MAPGSTAALILGLASGRLQPEASILLGPGLGARSARGWRPGPGVLASRKTGQTASRQSFRPPGSGEIKPSLACMVQH